MFEQLRAYPRSMWMFSLATVISSIGETFLWPLTTLYITKEFGQSLTTAATVLLLQHSGALCGNVLGGMLFDRWNGRKTIISAILLSIGILIAMGFCKNFYGYVALLMMLGFCNGMFWPSTRALAISIWPEGGRRSINAVYVATNIGVAIGAASGGLLASISFQLAFFGNALTYVLFLVLFMLTITDQHLLTGKVSAKSEFLHGQQLAAGAMDTRKYIALSMLVMGMAALVIIYVQWQTTISSYTSSLGIPLSSYSVLWTVNGLVIVFCQPLLSWMIYRFEASTKAQIIIGSILFTISMGIVTMSTTYTGFVLAMIFVTLGEMLVWPGVPALAADMAPPDRQGFFQGLVTSAQSTGRMVGPLLGSFLYEKISPQGMLSTMTLLTLVTLLFFYLYQRVDRVPAREKMLRQL